MPRIRFTQPYANFKAGQEFDVPDLKPFASRIERGIVEVVKAKAETATAPKAETATQPDTTQKKAAAKK